MDHRYCGVCLESPLGSADKELSASSKARELCVCSQACVTGGNYSETVTQGVMCQE